jgi:hypothetical protein
MSFVRGWRELCGLESGSPLDDAAVAGAGEFAGDGLRGEAEGGGDGGAVGVHLGLVEEMRRI